MTSPRPARVRPLSLSGRQGGSGLQVAGAPPVVYHRPDRADRFLLTTRRGPSDGREENDAMSLSVYKILHIFGILLTFGALGAITARALAGRDSDSDRKLAGISHGLGLVIVLVSGFGALAKLGLDGDAGFPLWFWLKLALWLVLGASIVFIRRLPQLARLFWVLLPVLGALGAYLAFYKPT